MNQFLIFIKDKYADFEGKETRRDYWMFVLGSIIFQIIFALLTYFIGNAIGMDLKKPANAVVTLFLLLPSLSAAVRRLHDIGKSGWNVLWIFLPIIGQIYLLILLLRGSLGSEMSAATNTTMPEVGMGSAMPTTNMAETMPATTANASADTMSMAQVNTAQMNTVQMNTAQVNADQMNTAQMGTVQTNMAQVNSDLPTAEKINAEIANAMNAATQGQTTGNQPEGADQNAVAANTNNVVPGVM